MKSKLEIEFDYFESIIDLSQEDQELYRIAKEGLSLSYSPYSNFQVCSVARLTGGKIEWTTNQENASFPLSTCAEQGLIAYIGSHYQDQIVETIAIIGSPFDDIQTSPCGACRQIMSELEIRQDHPIRLLLFSPSGRTWIFDSIQRLLPLAFVFPRQ